MTQLEKAKNNEITKEMEYVSRKENIDIQELVKEIAGGRVVITASKLHKQLAPIGIGNKLKVKVNANIGSSPNRHSVEEELEKLKISINAGADTVMDLSTGGDIDLIRRKIIESSKVPIGTVPIYQAIVEKGNVLDLTENDFLLGIKKHIEDGVDFITIHAGLTKETLPLIKKRLMGVVSRGGSFTAKWMQQNDKENPIYTNFDKIIKMAKKHDVTLSLGDGLRPGCIKDNTDAAQLFELKKLGELAKVAYEQNVQVMIEGPGHVPLNKIKENIELQKKYCSNAPFYVLGPIVTDIAPGYDHITSAIGGALAAYYGANFLCYVTSAEHLGLPTANEVKEGVIASRIAAHAADIARGIKGAQDWDDKMSEARSKLDWKEMIRLSIDPKKASKIRERCIDADPDVCSMCGKFCAVKISKELD
ncbi:MAG: phosphomethylpyrimidine synthase ThiC [Nanoarchaeota archaeon]